MMVAIDQPNYLPWKGYFDLIHDVDLFVFYNDVQYTPRDTSSSMSAMTQRITFGAGEKRAESRHTQRNNVVSHPLRLGGGIA